jgi:tRNA A-37 threonylcarbamoyl transferase component Bud32
MVLDTQMENISFKKVSKGDVKGWLREEILNLLPAPFFEDPISSIQKMDGKMIEKSKLRFAAIFTLPTGRRIFFKRDITKGWLESLKYLLLPTKARKECFIAYQLQKRNLNIPQPFGWMEKAHWGWVKESYYLSEAIGSGVSLIEDHSILRKSLSIDELAKTLREIHEAGLFHKDLHAGNFLWDGHSLFLTDLHRAKIVRTLSLNQRLWNLSQLFHSLKPIWEDSDHLRFIEKYYEGNPFYLQKKEKLIQKVHFLMDRLQKRQWGSRSKRCLKESTEFSILKKRGIHYYYRKEFPLDRLNKVIEEHLRLTRERPSILAKKSPEVVISILNGGKNRICVKQFCYPHFLDSFKEHFRRSKGLKSWVAGNGLITRGIPSLKPLALMENRNWLGLRESYFLIEAPEADQELDRYILKGFENFEEKSLFIKAFALWLGHFHKIGLYHKDMKTCNILVSKSGANWNFHLLDLEDVLLDTKIDERRLFKNFLQLNTSTPKIITKAGRVRFFKEYFSLNPIIKNQKNFLRRLIEESRRRGLVYVSPQGVVTEKL